VLDLRNSAAGVESEALPRPTLSRPCTITYLQGRSIRSSFQRHPPKSDQASGGVLVNRGTAVRLRLWLRILENARGDVVGDKTFGDGSCRS